MADVLVRDVENAVLEKLKKQAKSNGRSLQAEVKKILTQSVTRPKMLSAAETARRIKESLRVREHSDSAELLREDRSR